MDSTLILQSKASLNLCDEYSQYYRHDADSTYLQKTEQYRIGCAVPDRLMPGELREYSASNDDVFIGASILLFFVFAGVMHSGYYVVWSRIKEFFSSKRVYADDNVKANTNDVGTIVALVMTSCASLSLLGVGFNPSLDFIPHAYASSYWMFGLFFAFALLLIVCKAIVYSMVNWVFFNKEYNRKWFSSYIMLYALAAFILYPVMLMKVFFSMDTQIVIGCLLSVVILIKTLTLYKLISNFKAKNYGRLLFFLYFCAVEIVPTIVMWHIIDIRTI